VAQVGEELVEKKFSIVGQGENKYRNFRHVGTNLGISGQNYE